MPCNPVESETMPLEPGDTFVLFSDGVSEAINPEMGFYGEDRLLTTLQGLTEATPTEIAKQVLADVRAFAAGAKQSDDITIVAARYSPDR